MFSFARTLSGFKGIRSAAAKPLNILALENAQTDFSRDRRSILSITWMPFYAISLVFWPLYCLSGVKQLISNS